MSRNNCVGPRADSQGADFVPKGHVAMSGDIFVVTSGGRILTASNGVEARDVAKNAQDSPTIREFLV